MNKAITWKKLPAIQGRQQPCLHAGVAENLFTPDDLISVGFGSATLTCDNRVVYDDSMDPDSDDECMTGAQAEKLAANDPDHDWRISLRGAMSGREYQRHGTNRWMLVHQAQGFA